MSVPTVIVSFKKIYAFIISFWSWSQRIYYATFKQIAYVVVVFILINSSLPLDQF